MFTAEALYNLLLLLPGLLLSLTVHEFAHARTAQAFRDDTARLMGRCTLNPLRHLDPVGTLAIIFITLTGAPGIGWAKPVPVTPLNLQPRRLGDIAVSMAGPLSNLAMAVVFGGLLKLLLVYGPGQMTEALYNGAGRWLTMLLLVNVSLFAFNLLPIYPLDGHHILREVLPGHLQEPFMRWQGRYGVKVLFTLLLGPRIIGSILPNQDIIDPLMFVLRHVHIATLNIGGLWDALDFLPR